MSFFDENEELEWQKGRRLRDIKREWLKEARAIRDADPDKKTLLREAKAEALDRLEKSARTVEGFEKVNARWDIAEIVEGWRIAKHEVNVIDEMENYALPENGRLFPLPFDHICWPQLLKGKFIDYMSDCIFTFHDMAGITPIHNYLKSLSNQDRRRIMYYRVIRQWTPQHIAFLLKMSDRNVRKVYGNMIKAVRRSLFKYLVARYFSGIAISLREKEFCTEYLELIGDEGFYKIMREIYSGEYRKDRGNK